MPDFISLSCPSCGHKLQITEDIDRFACAACGNEHIVNRNGGIVTLKPLINGIRGIRVGVDKTAAELAISRIQEEINQLGEPIELSEAFNIIAIYPSRRAIFMRAYEQIKGIHRSSWDIFLEGSTIRDCQQAFSTLVFEDLVKLTDSISTQYPSEDDRIVKSTLNRIIKSTIRKEKLKELAKYFEIISKNK